MGNLCLFTIHNPKSGRPRCVGIRANGQTVFKHLFRPGEGKSIKHINTLLKSVRSMIIKASRREFNILLSDFKQYLVDFDLPLDSRQYGVHDLNLPKLESTKTQEEDEATLIKILDTMENRTPKVYQRVMADAAVVYQDLERRGIMQNYSLQHPQWSLKTFSGRSKSMGFNVQGWHENDHIRPPGSNDKDVLIHFDWICADIRVASLLANDRLLQRSFEKSDPYALMMKIINNNSDTEITRDECKIFLLKSINSMDFTSVALIDVYKSLGRWIYQCKKDLNNGVGGLDTMLGRKFKLAHAKNELAVLNGVMQGSVAHAMQRTIRKIWEQLPHNIVTEIHDSLVLCCSRDSATIKSLINIVTPIMFHPFEGLLPSNPAFPLKISIGTRWKEWKHYKTIRSLDGQTETRKIASDSPEEQAEKAETGKAEETESR